MFATVSGFTGGMGLLTALDTLAAQAIGAGILPSRSLNSLALSLSLFLPPLPPLEFRFGWVLIGLQIPCILSFQITTPVLGSSLKQRQCCAFYFVSRLACCGFSAVIFWFFLVLMRKQRYFLAYLPSKAFWCLNSTACDPLSPFVLLGICFPASIRISFLSS